MEENVLIKSKMDEKAKSLLFGIAWSILGIGIIPMLLLFVLQDDYTGRSGWYSIFKSSGDVEIYYTLLIIGCVLLVIGLILILYFSALAKCELTITEHIIKGSAFGGKEVSLPLNQISAYSIKKRTSSITVSTSAGIVMFSLIANYKEICDVLAKLISDSKENTSKTEIKVESKPQNSSMDDLMKLKELLDAGIISQEEFDAKKKQLLGL